MSNPNELKPAYPFVKKQADCPQIIYAGLTKLEAFTLAAMQGLCASSNRPLNLTARLAEDAVTIARATLAELAKEGE